MSFRRWPERTSLKSNIRKPPYQAINALVVQRTGRKLAELQIGVRFLSRAVLSGRFGVREGSPGATIIKSPITRRFYDTEVSDFEFMR